MALEGCDAPERGSCGARCQESLIAGVEWHKGSLLLWVFCLCGYSDPQFEFRLGQTTGCCVRFGDHATFSAEALCRLQRREDRPRQFRRLATQSFRPRAASRITTSP